jgi:wyosine [tRNA(Phe)-imidazoG37] synthetase (radical SAM superfamily)
MTHYEYLFGPVPSRRMGRSLGVDLLPFKTCSLNCIFCEVGTTTVRTLTRDEYVPIEAIQAELLHWLEHDGQADFITLAGSGEPTLHTQFGQILSFIKEHSKISTALLTNGTLFTAPDVRRDAAQADVVKVSLSAGDEATYAQIHRPARGILLADMITAYQLFREEFNGQLWIEVFLVAGINDSPESISQIAEITRSIRPDRVDLNTAVRPTADPAAHAVDEATLHTLAAQFDPPANVAVSFTSGPHERLPVSAAAVRAMLKRRPCSAEQITASFGAPRDVVDACLKDLTWNGLVRSIDRHGEVFFQAES